MSNEKYLWKYSPSLSPQHHSSIYLFSLAELRWLGLWLMLLSVATGARPGLAQEGSSHPLKPGCRHQVDQGEKLFVGWSLYTALYTRCTVKCTVTVHWLQQPSWALQGLQQPPLIDKVTLQLLIKCRTLIGQLSLNRPFIGSHVVFLRLMKTWRFTSNWYKTGSHFIKMTHGK